MSSIWGFLWLGVASGVITWGAYAVGEITVAVLRPLLQGYGDLVYPGPWAFTTMATASYLIAGTVLGGLSGVFLARARGQGAEPTSGRFQGAAALTLVLAYLANLSVAWNWDTRAFIAVIAGTVVFVAAVVAVRRQRPESWTGLLTDPWTLALILLGAPILGAGFSVRKLGAFLVAVLIANVASRSMRMVSWQGLPVLQLASVLLGIPAVVLATLAAETERPRLAPAQVTAAADQTRPNVVLLVLDTVRADHLSVYGYSRDTTPFLKELAREATLFRRPIAVSNFTLPTHATIFTGLHVRSHGATHFPPGTENQRPLERKYTTLAEILSGKGYVTAAIVANSLMVSPDFGLHQGFQLFDVRELVPWLPGNASHYLRYTVRKLSDALWPRLEFDETLRHAGDITGEALALLPELQQRRAPFFLFLNYMDAHGPYLPPPPFDTMYPGKDKRMNLARGTEVTREVTGRRRKLTEAERNHFVSQYDGGIAYVDSQIRLLTARLDAMGVLDNTMLIITSDHGEAFGEHSIVGHGTSLYQHQVLVPLIIKYPGQKAGKTVDALVSQVDLLPTVLETAGIEIPANLPGRSLTRAESSEPVAVFAEAYTPAHLLDVRPRHPAQQTAVFLEDFKLVSSSPGASEVYNLGTDPKEEHDLADADGARSRALLNALDVWMKRVPFELNAGDTKQLDPRTLERLRALGYVR